MQRPRTGWRAVHGVMQAAKLDGPHVSPKGVWQAYGMVSGWRPSPPASRSTWCRNGAAMPTLGLTLVSSPRVRKLYYCKNQE